MINRSFILTKKTEVTAQTAIKLEDGHSIECITHAGHSIAFNTFTL